MKNKIFIKINTPTCHIKSHVNGNIKSFLCLKYQFRNKYYDHENTLPVVNSTVECINYHKLNIISKSPTNTLLRKYKGHGYYSEPSHKLLS
jgi:hypothetical protein